MITLLTSPKPLDIVGYFCTTMTVVDVNTAAV